MRIDEMDSPLRQPKEKSTLFVPGVLWLATLALADYRPARVRGCFVLRGCALVSAVVTMLLVFAASWSESSKMAEIEWIPEAIGSWADREPNFRTAVPFVFLGFVLSFGLLRLGGARAFMISFVSGSLVLLLAEGFQRDLPTRTPDLGDFGWGMAGMAAGLAVAGSLMKVLGTRSGRKEAEK